MAKLIRAGLLFAAIGLLLYAGVYYAAEQLMVRHGHSNAFYKIASLRQDRVDWVVLGASHAMPLDFSDFNREMEAASGQRIVNLAAQGAGPLYNRFVFEHFAAGHKTRNVLYVVDSFAFYSRTWNEDRFADAKLLRGTPYEPSIARELWYYVRREGVDPLAAADYMSGFSKINNRERFQTDIWEGEKQFDRVYPSSPSATAKRIAYLYPDQTPQQALDRYLDELGTVVTAARDAGARVVIIKMPVPPQYAARLPGEAGFDGALSTRAAAWQAGFCDFTAALPDSRLYFDTDHLNRAGVRQFFDRNLKAILVSDEDARHSYATPGFAWSHSWYGPE